MLTIIQMTVHKQYHHSDPGKYQCCSYSSLFYPLLRVCGLQLITVPAPREEKHSTVFVSEAFLQSVPPEQVLEAMKTLRSAAV